VGVTRRPTTPTVAGRLMESRMGTVVVPRSSTVAGETVGLKCRA